MLSREKKAVMHTLDVSVHSKNDHKTCICEEILQEETMRGVD